jgi:hypothetical protein
VDWQSLGVAVNCFLETGGRLTSWGREGDEGWRGPADYRQLAEQGDDARNRRRLARAGAARHYRQPAEDR